MLSVCIIAKDAASTLEKCIASVSDLSDDVVVIVDASSSDNTSEIASKYASNIKIHAFKDFSSQKNYAASIAKYDWVLSLDADEWASLELVKEIQSTLRHPQHSCYRVSRINYIFGKAIRHTNWDPHGLIRLYNRNLASWIGTIHESIITRGSIGNLTGRIFHTNYLSVDQFFNKLNFYTTQEANYFYQKGKLFTFTSAFFLPLKDFFRRYVWHAGFLDGWHGFFLSLLMVIYHFSTQVKLWQKTIHSGSS